MNPNGRKRSSGFVLMEVLVALGVLSLAMGLAATAYAHVLQLRGAQDRYRQRLAAADFLLRRIAAEVRPGRAFLPRAGEFAAGEDTLILSTGDAIVVYRAEGGKVERIEIRKDGVARDTLLDAPKVKVSFLAENFEDASGVAARSAIVTAEWDENPIVGISHPTLSLRIAPRCR